MKKSVVLWLCFALLSFSACKKDKESYDGADGIPGLAWLASLHDGKYNDKLIADGYSFVGWYDSEAKVAGYAKPLAENWQAIVTVNTSGKPSSMFYDKQLAAEPYPYVEAAARFRKIMAEERVLIADSSVATFRASIVDNPGDTTSAARRFTDRAAFHRAIEAYFGSADSVSRHQKAIKLATTSASLSVTVEFNTYLTHSLRQSSIAVSRR